MIPEEIIKAASELLPDFIEHTEDIPYVSGGILPSEMLLFCSACLSRDVANVVESGRRNGFSTRILCEMLDNGFLEKFTSMEIDPDPDVDSEIYKKYPEVSLLKGDSTIEIRHHSYAGMLLDGPKGPQAMNILKVLRPNVGAIHDLHKYVEGGGENKWRGVAETTFPNAFFSDDEQWLDLYAHLDERCLRGEYASREEMTACGFTLMVNIDD